MSAPLLILDGDRWQRETLAAALAYEGCRAEHVGEAGPAMTLLAQHRCRLALIDPTAPATGGWGTIQLLMRLYPELPIIVLTTEEPPRRPTPIDARIWVVQKPVGFACLLRAIQKAISGDAEPGLASAAERELKRPAPGADPHALHWLD